MRVNSLATDPVLTHHAQRLKPHHGRPRPSHRTTHADLARPGLGDGHWPHRSSVARLLLVQPAAQAQGRVTYSKSAEEIARTGRTLLEYTWNHTTLVAFKTDKNLTYLQSAFVPEQHLEQVRRMKKLLAPEVQMHTEFIRNMDGLVPCTALQIVKFTTEDRLQGIMQIHRDNGVHINNPHVNMVEDGKARSLLSQAVRDIKKRFDPLDLLNPGKVRAWAQGVTS